MKILLLSVTILSSLFLGALAQQCGTQGGGASCSGGLCCSQWGWCGSTPEYCGAGCQSNCKGGATAAVADEDFTSLNATGPVDDDGRFHKDITYLITETQFETMLKHRGDGKCRGKFFTYRAFITAVRYFREFAYFGTNDVCLREVAAFFAQTSHQTTGGYPIAPDGPYAWGYCNTEEQGNPGAYCKPHQKYPCFPGKKYYGRGPMQISWNHNYGQAGKAIGVDLLRNPELVATDPVGAFKTALWFWMTPQGSKPSCHDVVAEKWKPSPQDKAANRLPGFGLITNVINGELECGKGPNPKVQDRIGFFNRFAKILGVDPGQNLDCYKQKPYGQQ